MAGRAIRKGEHIILWRTVVQPKKVRVNGKYFFLHEVCLTKNRAEQIASLAGHNSHRHTYVREAITHKGVWCVYLGALKRR